MSALTLATTIPATTIPATTISAKPITETTISATSLQRSSLQNSSSGSSFAAKLSNTIDARHPSDKHEVVNSHGDNHSDTSSRIADRVAVEFSAVERQWAALERKQRTFTKQLPAEIRPLVEVQRSAQELSFATQAVSQCGEAVAGTIRRLQQLGGS